MLLVADESVEAPVVDNLRAAGYAVLAVASECPGAVDERVLALAERRGAILITNDKDFAHLAFLQRSARQGIVLIRLPRWRSAGKATRTLAVVRELGANLRRHMTVIEAMGVRRRRLPT